MASVMVTLLRSSQKMAVMIATTSQQDLCTVAKMLEEETVRPVIDQRYSLDQVREALQYLTAGHAQGK